MSRFSNPISSGEGGDLPQPLATTSSPTFSKITLTSNGATDNITIGDDVILGDGNVANHVVIIGQQDATAGGIVLGTNETEVISTDGTDLSVTANNDIILLPGSNYAYLNVVDPDHRLATMSDISGGSGADIADFVFTDNYNETGSSGISLPGDKAMTIESGADSDMFLTAGDDLFLKTLNDDIHLLSNDDIRFVANVANGGTEPSWRMDGGDGYLYGPGSNSELKVVGLMGESTVPLFITGGDAVVLDGTNGEYLNDSNNADNQIAKIGDLSEDSGRAFQSVQWTPNFEATGLVFTGSGATYPTYNSYYVKQGQLVSFWIAIDLSTVTNFGTGQLKTALPFAPLAGTMNHFSGWVFVDETANPDLAGHVILNADHLANTSVLDLHYIKQQGGANSPVMEAMLIQGTPVTLTTNTNIYINGTYIAAQ